MTYFKQPKKTTKQISSVDGFIRRDGRPMQSASHLKLKFQTSYSPERPLDELRSNNEDFTSRRQTASFTDNATEQKDDFTMNSVTDVVLAEETKRKHRFFHKKSEKKSKRKKSKVRTAAKSFAILLIALVIGVSSLFAYGYIKARNIFKGDGEGAAALQKDVDPAKLNGEGDGRVNILLLGKGGPGHEGPDLTDTLLLASIDPVQNEVALVSVPRDMYVKNEGGYSMKINSVYATAKQARLANGSETDSDKEASEIAGLKAVKNSVSEVLGIPVHYYMMIDFTAFEEAINTVGGITIDVKSPVSEQMYLNGKNYFLNVKSGTQDFDSLKAFAYVRCRHCDNRSDFGRTERQREVILALQQKVLTLGTFSNPFKVVELLGNFGNRVRTDLNGVDEIKRLYEIGQQIGSDKIVSVGLADPPNVLVGTDMIGDQSVVLPTAGLYQYDEIHKYIRNNLRDAYLKSEDAKVLILNGSGTPGLATATSIELESYGYNVIGVDNAPTSDYVANQLIDLTNGAKRYTKSYLERRLGLTSTTQAPDGVPGTVEADFVIILGTNEITKTTN